MTEKTNNKLYLFEIILKNGKRKLMVSSCPDLTLCQFEDVNTFNSLKKD